MPHLFCSLLLCETHGIWEKCENNFFLPGALRWVMPSEQGVPEMLQGVPEISISGTPWSKGITLHIT